MRLVLISIFCLFTVQSIEALATAAVKKSMRQMADDVRHLQDGIFTENFAKIKKYAKNLADRPRVFDREQINKILDKEAGKFSGAEQIVHQAAHSIAAAAERKQMKDVLNHTFRMIHNCTSCHTEFKSTVVSAMSR